MGRTLHCPEWEEKLSLYVDGVLNPFDENAVEAHLARCDACRATVQVWQSVGDSVRRLPRELPPPQLRERILASTTRRRSLPHRFVPNWRVLAPALGVGLLLSWWTLPRDEAKHSVAVKVGVPRVEVTVPVPESRDALSNLSPRTPLVVQLGSAPTFRTATPAPRWMAHTRLSPLSNAPDAVPPVIVPSTPAPQFVPIASAPPTVVTEVAEAHEQPALVPSTPAPPPRPAAVSAAADLAERLQQLRQQLREEDRQQIAGTAQREAEKRRFLIPIVIVELE